MLIKLFIKKSDIFSVYDFSITVVCDLRYLYLDFFHNYK